MGVCGFVCVSLSVQKKQTESLSGWLNAGISRLQVERNVVVVYMCVYLHHMNNMGCMCRWVALNYSCTCVFQSSDSYLIWQHNSSDASGRVKHMSCTCVCFCNRALIGTHLCHGSSLYAFPHSRGTIWVCGCVGVSFFLLNVVKLGYLVRESECGRLPLPRFERRREVSVCGNVFLRYQLISKSQRTLKM